MGFGARAQASAQDFAEAFEARADMLAAPEFLGARVAFEVFARECDLPVLWISRAELVAVEAACLTRSDYVRDVVGVASVAEGCALAGVRRLGQGVLLGARIVAQNGRVTCARAKRSGDQ